MRYNDATGLVHDRDAEYSPRRCLYGRIGEKKQIIFLSNTDLTIHIKSQKKNIG
jgi:hypothetical protein